MSNIGKRIIEARTARGLSQEDLAARSGVSQGTIGHLESGRNKTSTKLPEIAAALGLTVEQLTGRGVRPGIGGTGGRERDWGADETALPEASRSVHQYVISRTGEPEIDGEVAYEVEPDDDSQFLYPVPDDRMAPRYMQGDYAIVEPGTEPDIEDDVLVKLINGEVGLYRLISRRSGIRLGSWNTNTVGTYGDSDITWIYYVAGFVPARKIRLSDSLGS